MVTIKKLQTPDGYYYEIDDFAGYVRALQERGLEAPRARYRVYISRENLADFSNVLGGWEDELKRFFKLSPATEVECQVVES